MDLSLFDLKLEESERVGEEAGIGIIGGLPLIWSAEDALHLKLDGQVAFGEDDLAHYYYLCITDAAIITVIIVERE